MNINLKDTLVDDTIIVQVQPVLEQVQTVTTHFDIVGNLLWDNLFAPLLFGISIPLVYKFSTSAADTEQSDLEKDEEQHHHADTPPFRASSARITPIAAATRMTTMTLT